VAKRVAVLAYFSDFGPALSYHRTTLTWQRLLLSDGYDARLYVKETANVPTFLKDQYKIVPALPRLNSGRWDIDRRRTPEYEKDVEAAQAAIRPALEWADVVIAHDFILLRGYTPLLEGLRRAWKEAEPKPRKVIHVYHSLPQKRPPNLVIHESLPGTLRYQPMPFEQYAVLSNAARLEVANSLLLDANSIGVIPNPAYTPSPVLESIFGWRPFERAPLFVNAFCATRWEHKGMAAVCAIVGALSEWDVPAGLLCVTVNGRGKTGRAKLAALLDWASTCGLVLGENLWISSLLSEEYASGLPFDLAKEAISNGDIMVFPSSAEMCPNTLIEGAVYGLMTVIPKGLEVGREVAPHSLSFDFPGLGKPKLSDEERRYCALIAREIYAAWRSNHQAVGRAEVRARRLGQRLLRDYLVPLIEGPLPQNVDLRRSVG